MTLVMTQSKLAEVPLFLHTRCMCLVIAVKQITTTHDCMHKLKKVTRYKRWVAAVQNVLQSDIEVTALVGSECRVKGVFALLVAT